MTSAEIQTALNHVQNSSGDNVLPSQPSQHLLIPPQAEDRVNWKQTIINSVGIIATGAALFYAAKVNHQKRSLTFVDLFRALF